MVDGQLVAAKIKHAAIVGLEGGIWAKSAGFPASDAEAKNLASNFNSPGVFQASGLSFGGSKYFFLSALDREMRFRKGNNGVSAFKTNKAVIISIYEEPMNGGEAALITGKLGDYLVNSGF